MPISSLLMFFFVLLQTFNIWSHLLGTVLFGALSIKAIVDVSMDTEDELIHKITMTMYCAAAVSLCLFSSLFHILSCSSEAVYVQMAKLDYTGIALMILFSFFPCLYNLFYCRLDLVATYSICITVLVTFAIYVSWSPGSHSL